MKKLLEILRLLSLLIITGCASSPEEVDLKSDDQVLDYVESHFGKATIIDKKENKEENTIIYTMKDQAQGFTYTVTSAAVQFNVDATEGGYMESTTHDFDECYQEYIVETLDFDHMYKDALYANRSGHDILFSVVENDEMTSLILDVKDN